MKLEEAMFGYYKKPCRKIFDRISIDPIIQLLGARHGSVIINDREVVVVVDPADLSFKSPGIDFEYEVLHPTKDFYHGTTIVMDGYYNTKVVYHLNPESKEAIRARRAEGPWIRWAVSIMGTREFTCFEEVSLAGRLSAKNLQLF
jgi:hypothetical protein